MPANPIVFEDLPSLGSRNWLETVHWDFVLLVVIAWLILHKIKKRPYGPTSVSAVREHAKAKVLDHAGARTLILPLSDTVAQQAVHAQLHFRVGFFTI
jgi:hypothetical protein